MINLEQFKTEKELRNWAKINGYDRGGQDRLIEQWKTLSSTSPSSLFTSEPTEDSDEEE